jgi:Glycosyl transferase family 11
LELDLTFLLDRTREQITFRDFDLGIFGFQYRQASQDRVRKFRRLMDPASRTFVERIEDKLTDRYVYVEPGMGFHPEVLDLPDNTYLEGYFQDERYFDHISDEIRARFNFQPEVTELSSETRKLADEMQRPGSICIHVRRGDYVNDPTTSAHHGICSIDYYKNGLASLRNSGARGPIFVFSDDTKWCSENFGEWPDVMIVEDEHAGPRGSIHFWLMTLCHNFVIANSTFSWWAAWLSRTPDKIVIYPSRWSQSDDLKNINICPESWVRVASD